MVIVGRLEVLVMVLVAFGEQERSTSNMYTYRILVNAIR